MRKDRITAGIGILIIVVFFILASYVAQNGLYYIEDRMGDGFLSMVGYVFILVVATVIAPVSAIPLMPIASNMWGWFLAGVLSIAGWIIGAVIAFFSARKWGVPLVKKIVSLEKIERFEKMIPQENIFWGIVLFRIVVPVDFLSYVLGLFSHVKFRVYFWASLVGMAPFAFTLAYVGVLPFSWQVIAFLTGLVALVILYLVVKGRGKLSR